MARLGQRGVTARFIRPDIEFKGQSTPPMVPGYLSLSGHSAAKQFVDDLLVKGSPSDLWNDDIVKITEWLKWYTNGNVRYDFVVDPKWHRAPKESEKYNALNNAPRGDDIAEAGGLTPDKIAADFVGAVEDSVDLSNVSAIFIYHPEEVRKIVGQWTTQEANVKTKKYGTITPMMVATGGDTYLSKRVRWGYFIHELLHAHGLFGHSPKFLPSFKL